MPPKAGVEYPAYLTLRLDAETRKKLEELAKEEKRSVGAMTRIIIEEGLKVLKEKKPKKKPA
jgi:predicted transcriptional regulator